MKTALFLAASFATLLSTLAHAGQASVVSADDAQAAVTQGASVIDVRSAVAFEQGHVAQAAAVTINAAQLPLHELAAVLSKAGIDSSRTMLIIGDAGDTNAQALWQRLANVTSGRVLWLVGGIQEWQMRGHALTTQIAVRHPVPQVLVSFDAPAHSLRMAGGRLRTHASLERDWPIKVALN